MKPQRHPIEPLHRPSALPLHLAPASPFATPEQTSIAPVRERPSRPLHEEISVPTAEPLKCVWSGYPHHERDCRSRIPTSVVVKAWQRERQLNGTVEDFFNFAWREGVWLAFGLQDGSVRGVYCPTHRSQRHARECPEPQR